MKKFLKLFVVIMLVACFANLFGCYGDDYYYEDGGDYSASYYVTSRKISYYVDLSLLSVDVGAVVSAVDEKALDLNGYVAYAHDYYDDGEVFSSSRDYRVPTELLKEFVEFIESQGKVEDKDVTSYDFTEDYLNVLSRQTALQNKKQTLTELLNEEGISSSDKIAILNEIANVEEQLAIINLSLENYDEDAEYSTVYVYFDTEPTVWEVLIPLFIVFVTPAIVLSAIFIPKAVRKRKRQKAEIKF